MDISTINQHKEDNKKQRETFEFQIKNMSKNKILI
jgi:hypothetical protein